MTPMNRPGAFTRCGLVAAMLAAFPVAQAQEASATEGSVTVGVGGVSADSQERAVFGQYNGLRVDGLHGLLDFDYYRRDDEAGTVAKFRGIGMLGENRELHLLWKRQGNWKLAFDFGELVRRDPRTINTGLLGAGTTMPQVVYLAGGPGTGTNLDLKTKRQGLGMTFSKWLSPAIEFQASLKTENKDGARLFGSGFGCPSPLAPGCAPTTGSNPGWATLMLPEPIDSNHSQVEARLSYAGQRLRLSGGYYGSFYNNSNGALTPTVPGSLNNAVGVLQPLNTGLLPILTQPLALAPDNQAHQIDLTGTYVFTPTLRGTFKLGMGRATQDQGFAGAGFVGPAGVTSLDGRVDTALAQFGLAARPTPKLSLLADYRFDDRDDRTPLALYNAIGGAGTTTYLTYTNRNRDYTKSRGKLQASYQFDANYRGTLGVDYESIDRGTFTPTSAVFGVSALRQKTEEIGWRAELRRRMTETFSGGISYVASRRDGSGWLRPVSWGGGVVPYGDPGTYITSTATFMPTLADRERNKLRLHAVWQPSDALTLQFSGDYGRDRFSSPSVQGLQRTDMHLLSIDGDYALSVRWSLNGYISRGNQTLDQARPAGYIMAFDNDSTAAGLGVTGRPVSQLQIGGTLSYFNDRNVYAQTLDPATHLADVALLRASGGLPDVVFRTVEWRLFGRYTLSKTSSVRLDLVHQRARFNDWTYGIEGTPFLFSDNTTVSQLQKQNVTYIGLSFTHRWQ